nr:hypothetical protein Iba_chr01fCG6820 [Ipomoea batatas]GME08637.1 hypothetical protein Iba_scaffold7875CG0020 [Ipomoea batatas]
MESKLLEFLIETPQKDLIFIFILPGNLFPKWSFMARISKPSIHFRPNLQQSYSFLARPPIPAGIPLSAAFLRSRRRIFPAKMSLAAALRRFRRPISYNPT